MAAKPDDLRTCANDSPDLPDEKRCPQYRTILTNGDEVYCPRCRANKAYWTEKRNAAQLRDYSAVLRFRVGRISEWAHGVRSRKVVPLRRKVS